MSGVAVKHGNNKATFTSKRRAARGEQLKHGQQQRKSLAKIALDNPNNPKLRRDPGVPDLAHLHSALERRAVAMDLDRKYQRSQAHAQRRLEIADKKAAKSRGISTGEMQTSATGGKLRVKSDELHNDARDVASRRHYWSEMLKVIDASDIILEVLDARDPLGCRCREVESLIQSKMDRSGASPKRIILVLNKIDLVPTDNIQAWVKHLRREFPTIAFKSNTQQQTNNLKATTHVSRGTEVDGKTLQRSASVGSSALLQLLKNYSRSLNLKKQLTVGIIGFPNVGKSSLINSLTRARRAAVGNMPGLTKTLQLVKLDHQINLIDSPGVMFSAGRGEGGEEDSGIVLRNCLRFEQLEDPISAAYKVVERTTMEQLQQVYDLDVEFEDADQFLFLVAQKRGKLLRGGVPDSEGAARIVVKDWNDGRIAYHSEPPALDSAVGEADVVSQWSKEFDVEALLAPTVEDRQEAQMEDASEAARIGEREVLYDEADDAANQREAKPIVPRPRQAAAQGDGGMMDTSAAAASSSASVATPVVSEASAPPPRSKGPSHFNPQLNQQLGAEVKKDKRKQRKQANRMAAAAEGMEEEEDMQLEDGDEGFME